MPGEVQAKYIVMCIKKLEEIFLQVKALICDQGSNNIRMAKELGVTLNEPYFFVNDKRCYFFMTLPICLKH